MPKETRPPGRPEGKTYPHSKVIRFRDEDVERLQRLAQALGTSESGVIRQALWELARAKGLG
jgi:predicted transcriptional regulator